MAGDDRARLEASPQLEGFSARGIEVLLLTDPVDSFWVTPAAEFDGKPFKSVTQGAADLSDIPLLDDAQTPEAKRRRKSPCSWLSSNRRLATPLPTSRSPTRLTESAVCLVAPEHGPDRQFERLLSAAGRLDKAAKTHPGTQSAAPAHCRFGQARNEDGPSRRTLRISSTTKPASSTATSRSMPGPFQNALPG